jgi:guanylate kinase
MWNRQGTLFIIAAPSGAGKTTLVRAVINQLTQAVISISHTTRPQRPGEVDGVNYYFVTVEQFQALLQQDIFLEHAKVFDHYYGTSGQWVREQLRSGNDVILEIDWQGAQQIRLLFPHTVSVFIVPPSMQVLRQRLQERGQDSPEVIERRMQQAKAEISHYHEFDYLIVNDSFTNAVTDLKSIIHAQRLQSESQIKSNQKLLEALLSV